MRDQGQGPNNRHVTVEGMEIGPQDLKNPQPCSIPVQMADGTETIATARGNCPAPFTSDCGNKSIYDLVSVLFVPGLKQRLISLVTVSATESYSISIKKQDTSIIFPDARRFTWPLGRCHLNSEDVSYVTAFIATAPRYYVDTGTDVAVFQSPDITCTVAAEFAHLANLDTIAQASATNLGDTTPTNWLILGGY